MFLFCYDMAMVNVVKEIDNETAKISLTYRQDENFDQNGVVTPPNSLPVKNNDEKCYLVDESSQKSPTVSDNCSLSKNVSFVDRKKDLTSSDSDRSSLTSMCDYKKNTESEGEVTNAELGLSEDHFSQPEGHFCMSTVEELEMAIENCKELILESAEVSEKRKNLIKKLIQLRMKLQEVKDGPELVPPNMKMILGHHFVKRLIRRPNHYCEKCNGIIWGVLHTWHQCVDCGFSCHGKCLNLIQRTCASVKMSENPTYILNICPEIGLAEQNYRCAECRTHIMFTFPMRSLFCGWIAFSSENSWVEPRLCDYSGLHYCPTCHWNTQAVIPARVLHNWDFEQYKVCRASKQFLRLMKKRAVLKIQDINPMLFTFVEELNCVKKMREEILIMKRYFLACKNALENKLLLMLAERQHFVENSDMYSMQDLIDVQSGVLVDYLTRIHARFVQHITKDCDVCRGQGFICELCQNKSVIFPFDNSAAICEVCSWVYHKECFNRKEKNCPKCARKMERAQKKLSEEQ